MFVNIFSFAPLPKALQERRCVAALQSGGGKTIYAMVAADCAVVQNNTK